MVRDKVMKKLYDRFSFDNYFRELLREGYTHEEAIEFIKYTCSLSALTIQERIENEYYKKISLNETMSQDLKDLRQEIFNKIYPYKN